MRIVCAMQILPKEAERRANYSAKQTEEKEEAVVVTREKVASCQLATDSTLCTPRPTADPEMTPPLSAAPGTGNTEHGTRNGERRTAGAAVLRDAGSSGYTGYELG